MNRCRMFMCLAIYLINKSEGQFLQQPTAVQGCESSDVTISWGIDNYANAKFVTWKKGTTTPMSQSGSSAVTTNVDNVKHGGNGALIVLGVQSTDIANYACVMITATNSAFTSKPAALSILAAPSYPPRLESVVEINSKNHKCVLDKKGSPEVNVTIKIGSDEKSSDTYSVPCESKEDISCCVSGDAITCLPGSSVTKQCWKVKDVWILEDLQV